jgi:hypothetical protein
MFVNDTVDFSDFFVVILDGVGSTELAIVLRDGFKPCEPAQAPLAATDLGWRNHKYSLSAFKGQHIRLVFSFKYGKAGFTCRPPCTGSWVEISLTRRAALPHYP